MPFFSVLFLIGFLNALHHNAANLSIYFTECGFTKDVIGAFCLLGFPFSFKILWSPVIDHVPVPFFRNSPRKGWFILALLGMGLCFISMSTFSPNEHPLFFATSLLLLSLFAGCLYIVGIAYELESIPTSSYSPGSASLTAGYRTGLLYAGAGVLYIAHLSSWSGAFQVSAAITLAAALLVAIMPEPYKSKETLAIKHKRLAEYPSATKGILHETFVQPFRSFVQAGNWQMLLAVIVLFKVSDHIAKPMEGPFYLELGFNKKDLALAAKTFGFAATIAGAFFSGRLIKNKDPLRSLAILSLIHTTAECGCLIHSFIGKSYGLLYLTSGLGNFTGGMLITAFISLLWKTCDKHYATVQYAFLWSVSSLVTKMMACCGGLLASNFSWSQFFLLVCIMGFTSSGALMLLTLRTKKSGPHTCGPLFGF
jgi:MFS transporter, PAT family, beta-lactamase induction signal transducer AmpG